MENSSAKVGVIFGLFCQSSKNDFLLFPQKEDAKNLFNIQATGRTKLNEYFDSRISTRSTVLPLLQ